MESMILFRDNQEVQAADFTNMQDWVQQSIDDVVLDAIWQGLAYSGFGVTKLATTQINVAPGRLYSAGAVYANTAISQLDTYSMLPVTQNKLIAVVSWGTTVQTDIQPRDFIIDADTGQSQPQSVAMEQDRYANVGLVPGVEAAAPQNPVLSASQMLVATVLVSPTGVVSITQNTQGQIDSVQDLAERVASLEQWKQIMEGQINTLITALANLAAQLANYVKLTDFAKLVALVQEIWDLIHMPPPVTWTWGGTDYFFDTSMSNTAGNVDGAYNAFISEGLRFPGNAAVNRGPLALLNPSDPTVLVTANNMILPVPSGSRVRMDCSFRPNFLRNPTIIWFIDNILAYSFWSLTCRKLRPARHRHYCGVPFVPTPPAAIWAQTLNCDPIANRLQFFTESWTPVTWAIVQSHQKDDSCDWPVYMQDRFQYLWHDYCDQKYWSKTFDNVSVAGNQIAQTFLNAQDGWLTGVTIFWDGQPANLPGFTVLISRCDDDGTPNHTKNCIAASTLTATQVQNAAFIPVLNGDVDYDPSFWGINFFARCVRPFPVRVNIDPTFLEGGVRYAIHVIASSAFSPVCSNDWGCVQVHQGFFWTSSGTVLIRWPTSTVPKSMIFKLHYAVWGQWQNAAGNFAGGSVVREIDLAALQLAGGICGVDVLAEMIEPGATTLSWQVQIGGNWQTFNQDPNAPGFGSNPALLPFRVMAIGTTDLMPAFSLVNSQVTLHPPRVLTYHHISNLISVPSTMSQIKIMCRVHSFVSAHHTLAASFHTGATHALTSAATVADIQEPDGSLQRTWTWTGQSVTAANGFYVEIDGTTDGTGDSFVVSQRSAYYAT